MTEPISKREAQLNEACRLLLNLASHWERWRKCLDPKPSEKKAEHTIFKAMQAVNPDLRQPIRFTQRDLPNRLRFVLESLHPEGNPHQTLSECIAEIESALLETGPLPPKW